MRSYRSALPLVAVALTAAACTATLFPETEAPVYFEVAYEPETIACTIPVAETEATAIRVWEFGASQPYDQAGMIVIEGGGEVVPSSEYRWVAAPGSLLADALLRDLNVAGAGLLAIGASEPLDAPLELSGRVLRFAWVRDGSQGRAVLDVVVSVVRRDESADLALVFQETYRLESKPAAIDGPEGFVQSMGNLVEEFSARVRSDLCDGLAAWEPAPPRE